MPAIFTFLKSVYDDATQLQKTYIMIDVKQLIDSTLEQKF